MLSKRKFFKKIFFLPFSFFFINSTNKADAHSKKIEQSSDISGISKNEHSDKQIASQEILIQQGGTVQNALVSIYVDGFADPTGATDSTASILKAIELLNKKLLIADISEVRRLWRRIFGNGTYMIGDIPFLSGVRYRGQGQWATRISFSTPNARFCFTSLNTTDYYKKRVSGRLLQAGLFDLSIGFGYQEN